MKKYIGLSLLSLAASAFLIGCGSSSTTSDTEIGYFIDAPVAGMNYKTTSGLAGTTDAQGRFQYRKGDKVDFSLGKLNFGEAEPTAEGLVSPQELTQNQETLTLMLRTLQALDVDNNPSNGIMIPSSVITALETMSTEVDIASMSEDSNVLEIDDSLTEVLDEDYDGVIDVSDTQATTHFEQSMDKWHSGEKPDSTTNTTGNGQGQGTGQGGHGNGTGTGSEFDISDTPKTNLTQEIIDTLAYMGNEERLAHDIYMTLYNYHLNNGTELKQFTNIASRSEVKHIGIVQDLVRKYEVDITTVKDVVNPVADQNVALENMPSGQYDIQKIQDLYDSLYEKGITSAQDALEVGCMVEVVDVDDLDKDIAIAEAAGATDVVDGFNILRDGSYNHYWAFDKALKNMGVSEGCAVLGAQYDKTGVYPQNENGGQGHGRQ